MSPTPPPWKWLNYPDGRKLLTGPNNAVIHCPDAPLNISPEDACLVAAAPDLLAACKAFLAGTDSGIVWDMAAAAIATVEGSQDR